MGYPPRVHVFARSALLVAAFVLPVFAGCRCGESQRHTITAVDAPSLSSSPAPPPRIKVTVRSVKRAPMITEKDESAVLQLPVDQVWLDVETVITYTPVRCDSSKYVPRPQPEEAGVASRRSMVLFKVKDVGFEIDGRKTPASQGARDVDDLWPGQQGERLVTMECNDELPKSSLIPFHFYFLVPEELLPKAGTLTFAEQRVALEPFVR